MTGSAEIAPNSGLVLYFRFNYIAAILSLTAYNALAFDLSILPSSGGGKATQ